MQILLGTDPEVFMKQHGKFISAHGMVEGDKENPYLVKDGAVQVDGMALEAAIVAICLFLFMTVVIVYSMYKGSE